MNKTCLKVEWQNHKNSGANISKFSPNQQYDPYTLTLEDNLQMDNSTIKLNKKLQLTSMNVPSV